MCVYIYIYIYLYIHRILVSKTIIIYRNLRIDWLKVCNWQFLFSVAPSSWRRARKIMMQCKTMQDQRDDEQLENDLQVAGRRHGAAEFQDPKMEVLYITIPYFRSYFVEIFSYIALT